MSLEKPHVRVLGKCLTLNHLTVSESFRKCQETEQNRIKKGKMKRALIITSLAALLASGCATQMTTASGRPEVMITDQPVEAVKAEAINVFLGHGFLMAKSDNFTLTFEKDAGVAASILMGSRFNPTVNVRIVVNAIPQGTNVLRLVASPFMVSNPDSGFQRINAMGGKGVMQTQGLLNEIASKFGQLTDTPQLVPSSTSTNNVSLAHPSKI